MAEKTDKKPVPLTREFGMPQTRSGRLTGLFYSILNEMPVSIPGFWERHPGKNFWDIADEMMTDPHIQSVFRSRRAGVAGRPWEVIPAKPKFGRESSYNETQAKEIAVFVQALLAQIPLFAQAIRHLLKAVPYGHSVAEIMWRIDADEVRIEKLKTRRTQRFTLGDDNVLRLLDSKSGQAKDLPDRKFVCHKHDPQDDIPYATPLLVSCYWPWFFKKHGQSFWMIVGEKFGVPSVIGKYPAHFTDEDVKMYVRALITLQQDSVAAVPDGTEIDTKLADVTVGERGSFFRELLDFMNGEISKTVLGGTLTQEVGKVGSYAASQTHLEVRQDIIDADAELLQGTLDATLISWLVDFNYGVDVTQELRPSFVIKTAPNRGTPEFAQTLKTLADAGLDIPKSFVREAFGIPASQEGEEILEKSTSAAPPIFREKPRPFGPGQRRR